MAGPSCATCGFIDSIYQYGGGNSFDIAAYHDYGSDPIAAAFFTHDSLVAHGQGSKPIWLGEHGVRGDSGSDRQPPAGLTQGLAHTRVRVGRSLDDHAADH